MPQSQDTVRVRWAIFRERFAAAYARFFQPREILVRADGRVAYVTLSSRLQQIAAAVTLVGFVWLAYATVSFLVSERQLADKNDEIERAQRAYAQLMQDVAGAYDQFTQIARNMEANEAELLGLMNGAAGGTDLETLQGRLEDMAAARRTLDDGQAEMRQKLAIFQQDLHSIVDQNKTLTDRILLLEGQLAAVTETRDQAFKRQAELLQQIAVLDRKLETSGVEIGSRDDRIDFLQDMVASLTDERNQLQALRSELTGNLSQLEKRLSAMQASQRVAVEDLAERTMDGVEMVEKTVEMAGLDVEKLLTRAGEEMIGRGGPFVDLATIPDLGAAETVMLQVASLDNAVERWERLQYIMQTIPLVSPVDHYFVTSGFGNRKDPFNGKLARHEGVDMQAELGVPVMATAPGKVVFAGWQGDYGRMVEIDHGLGIHTRYAHLKSIDVQVGDEIDYREQLGSLGSSGRSSGPHVHYEVRVDGVPLDPTKFLKAGRYVFKS